ncbi:MAG: response regulator [Elusimicrobiota bacterium]
MKILIAEDDDINRELITEVLKSDGHEVTAVCDGTELIKIALDSKPDLIITDMQMPGMSGDTMISMIEEYEELASVPIIVMTGMGEVEFKKLGVSKDINVLFKPVNMSKLKEFVLKFKK